MDVKRIGGLEGLFIVMPFLYVNTFNHTSAPSTEILSSVCKTYRERKRFLASTCAGKKIQSCLSLNPSNPSSNTLAAEKQNASGTNSSPAYTLTRTSEHDSH